MICLKEDILVLKSGNLTLYNPKKLKKLIELHCAREVDTKRLFRYTLFLKVDTHDIFTSSCFTKVDIFQLFRGFLFQKLTRPCKYPYYQRVASSFDNQFRAQYPVLKSLFPGQFSLVITLPEVLRGVIADGEARPLGVVILDISSNCLFGSVSSSVSGAGPSDSLDMQI